MHEATTTKYIRPPHTEVPNLNSLPSQSTEPTGGGNNQENHRIILG